MERIHNEEVEYIIDKRRSDIVVKSNDLIEASYRLSLNEQRLILYMASKIKKDDSDFRIVKVAVKEFADTFGLDYKNIYKEMRKVTKSLTSKSISIKSHKSDKSDGYLHIAWLSSAEYINGTLELEFSEKMKPHLLELKNNFSQYALGEFVRFTSVYSIRLYQILKRYVGFRDGSKYYLLEDLRRILELEKKYPKYSNLKRRVIQAAIDEINDVSDINVRSYEDKEGKKVKGIKFVVERKEQHIESNVEEVRGEVEVNKELIITVKTLLQTVCMDRIVEDKDAVILLKEANNDVSKIMQKIMIVQQSKSKIENIMGFLIDGIRNDYNPIILSTSPDTRQHWNYSEDSNEDDFEDLARKSRNR